MEEGATAEGRCWITNRLPDRRHPRIRVSYTLPITLWHLEADLSKESRGCANHAAKPISHGACIESGFSSQSDASIYKDFGQMTPQMVWSKRLK